MSDTATSRAYAWALQTDYQTAKAIAAGALKKILATDENFIDYTPDTKNDEGWAHGNNQATHQWIEAHDAKVQHTMPVFAQEIGKVLLLNLGNYSVAAVPGGVLAKESTFKPQDPSVSRQGKAVTYAEKTGGAYNVLMPRSVGDGFTFKGDGNGVLMCDFGLQGAGIIDPASTVTWSGGTPTVTTPTGLHKLFNTQIGLVVTDAGSPTTYGCRYRAFEVAYKQTLLLEAGYKPGCQEFLVSGDPTSGVIRSACEFDKQMLDFSFEVDMASGSPELVAVQQQKPMDILLTATGGIIEGAIRHKISVIIPVAFYKTSKPTIKNGIYTFTVSGSAFFDYVTSKLFKVQLITDVADFSTGW